MLINSIHNGGNALEQDRIMAEHPAETECMLEDRILGWLAPTRGASYFLGSLGFQDSV